MENYITNIVTKTGEFVAETVTLGGLENVVVSYVQMIGSLFGIM